MNISSIKGKIVSLIKNGLLHILAGSFLTKAIAFFGSIFLVKTLSKFDYGVLSYLENMYSYAWVFAGMGMANVILRYVVLGKTTGEKKGYFSYAIKSGLIWNIALVIVMAIVNFIYHHKPEYAGYSWLLYVLILVLPFQYFCESAMSNERAMFANQRYMVFSVVTTFAFVAAKVILGHFWGLKGAVYGHVGVYVVLAGIFMFSTTRKHFGNNVLVEPLSASKKEINTYALQYMITNGLWAVFMLNDTFLLGRFVSPELLADYKVAYTIPGCVTLISSSIGIFVAPYFVKKENDHLWVKKYYGITMLVSAGVVALVCFGIGVLAKPVVKILYGQEYLTVVPIMRWLLVAAFMNCGLRYTTANTLAAMGKVKYNMIVSAVGITLQIGINLYAIPRYGVYGVAITSCIVYFVMALVLFVVFFKQYYSKGSMTKVK